jgi:hypothetical protein
MAVMCPDCTKATEGLHHGFTSNCRGCWARTVARSPDFARVRAAQWVDKPYLALIGRFGVTHNEVKAAADADAMSKEANGAA